MLSTSEVSSFGAAELRELPPTVAHRQVRARARHTHSLACTGYAAGWSAPEQHCVDRRDRLEVGKQARELRHARQSGIRSSEWAVRRRSKKEADWRPAERRKTRSTRHAAPFPRLLARDDAMLGRVGQQRERPDE